MHNFFFFLLNIYKDPDLLYILEYLQILYKKLSEYKMFPIHVLVLAIAKQNLHFRHDGLKTKKI